MDWRTYTAGTPAGQTSTYFVAFMFIRKRGVFFFFVTNTRKEQDEPGGVGGATLVSKVNITLACNTASGCCNRVAKAKLGIAHARAGLSAAQKTVVNASAVRLQSSAKVD